MTRRFSKSIPTTRAIWKSAFGSPDHPVDARRDVVGRDACGRNLVEQRREGVEVVLVDEGDVDLAFVERAGGGEAAEAGPDDDDVRPVHHRSIPETLPTGPTEARAA